MNIDRASRNKFFASKVLVDGPMKSSASFNKFKILFASLILVGFQQVLSSEKDKEDDVDVTTEQSDSTSADGRMTKKDAKAACRNEGKKGKDLKSCMKEKTK